MSMKSILFAGLISLLMISCDKELVTQLDTEFPVGQTNLKIIHASAYVTNYSAQLKVNGTRVSNNITNATPFPGGGLNTGGASSPWYMSLTPGLTIISLSVPKVGTSTDSISLFTGGTSLEPNAHYSAYLTDTAASTQLVVIKENISIPADGLSRFKFLNLMPNQPSIDLYFGDDKVASNILYKTAGPDFTLTRADTAHWYIRPAGALPTSAPIAVYPALSASPQTIPNQRVLTVFARGYKAGTGNRAPNISLLYN